jgi:hypothetical protein
MPLLFFKLILVISILTGYSQSIFSSTNITKFTNISSQTWEFYNVFRPSTSDTASPSNRGPFGREYPGAAQTATVPAIFPGKRVDNLRSVSHPTPDLSRRHHLHTVSLILRCWWENIWRRVAHINHPNNVSSYLFQNMLSSSADDIVKNRW